MFYLSFPCVQRVMERSQMWMRVLGLMVMAGMLLALGWGEVRGQEEGDDSTIYIITSMVKLEQSLQTERNHQAVVSQFLDRLINEAQKQGFELVIEGNTDNHGAAAFFTFVGSYWLQIRTLESPLAEISPALTDPLLSLELEPLDESVKMAAATLFYTQGKCNLAETALDSADVNFYYDVILILKLRGNCALLNGEYENAIKYYEAVERRLFFDDDSFNLAWAYLQVGREDEAFERADMLVRWFDNNRIQERIASLQRRSALYALAFRFDEAIADMDTAIEVASQFDAQSAEAEQSNNRLLAQLYVERGQRILLLYEWDRVLADYNTALELDPDYADAYYYRGILFYTQGRRDEALPDFARYLELAPDGEHAAEAAGYSEAIEGELAALEE